MAKCKLYQCKRCNKTYSNDEISRVEDVCRTCIRKEDTGEARRLSRLNVKRKSVENPEKQAVYYEENYL